MRKVDLELPDRNDIDKQFYLQYFESQRIRKSLKKNLKGLKHQDLQKYSIKRYWQRLKLHNF